MTDTPTPPPGGDFHDFLNAEIHAEVENMAGRSSFPITDCEREETYHLIEDFGVIEVQHEPTGEFRALPARLTFGASGYQLEIGEFNLGPRQIDVLRRAILAHIRHDRQSWTS